MNLDAWEFDAFFDYQNWTVGVSFALDTVPGVRVFWVCLGPLVILGAYQT